MVDFLYTLFSIALYVLQGIALRTIARRRGIRHSWLAWVPVGSLWILGSICDDFRQRTRGRKSSLRKTLVILMVAVLVLTVALTVYTMNTMLPIMLKAVTMDQLLEYYDSSYSTSVQDLYSESEDELMEEMLRAMDEKLTEQDLDLLLRASVVTLLLALALCAAAVAAVVVESICVYNLFASCDPGNKVLFLILGIWLGICPVFMFLCRNKDLGMPPVFPLLPQNGGYDNYWQNQNNM